jgi:hypothetical protein
MNNASFSGAAIGRSAVARKACVQGDHVLSWLMAYLQYLFGARLDGAGHAISDTSLSARLQSSEHIWMMLEGTHVLTLMLFAGTILFVDLRLLGLIFRTTPVSKVTDSVLPFTVGGFIVMVITGTALFFANPFEYYHNFFFRVKLAFLIAAAINIFLFHHRVQADRVRWDAAPKPPLSARASAAASLSLWIAVIIAGRYVAYDWYKCVNARGFIATAAQCAEHDATFARIQPELAR